MRRAFLIVASVFLGLVAVACGPDAGPGPAGDAATPSASDAAAPAAVAGTATFDFPTGPAVTVEAGYAPPQDRVASTGGYLPVNGKPTLVYVDNIW